MTHSPSHEPSDADAIAADSTDAGDDAEDGTNLLIAMVADSREETPRDAGPITGVVVGVLVGVGTAGDARVDFAQNPSRDPIAARTTVVLSEGDVGREVALLFERGDVGHPIVMGLIHGSSAASPAVASGEVRVERDDGRVVLTAEREIVLRCGKASITLTRAGKILIRGAHLVNRSSGVNRIQGGSVQIN